VRARLPRVLARALALAGLASACTTPLEVGERAYQQGDRESALAIWQDIDAAELDYASAQGRIQSVSAETQQLATRYLQRARYYEEKGRLAEAVLDYRIALRLAPGDAATLHHVQELVRRLARARSEQLAAFEAAFARGDLAAARVQMATLRNLDPFSPEVNDGQHRLGEALEGRIAGALADGEAEFAAEDYDAASRAFDQVLELDPQNESARGYLAYVARIHRDEVAAPASSDASGAATPRPRPGAVPRVRATDPELRAEGFLQNALVAEANGDPVQAIRYDLAALAADPQHAGARSHLAALRRALAPQVPGLIEAGRRYYQAEDLQAALDQWQRALLIDPSNIEARDHAERAENLLERLEELRSEPAPGRS
jgi:tetratricopeptide (TPR) repeat protein